jgi:hypothetical protein
MMIVEAREMKKKVIIVQEKMKEGRMTTGGKEETRSEVVDLKRPEVMKEEDISLLLHPQEDEGGGHLRTRHRTAAHIRIELTPLPIKCSKVYK